MKRNILCIIAVALLTIIGCSGGKINSDAIPGPLANMVPAQYRHGGQAVLDLGAAASLNEDNEDDLGQSVGVSLTNEYHILHDDALTKYVSLVGMSTGSVSSAPDIHFVFGILDTPEVNAFSGPNGYIFVTRGALINMQDEAELAGVLAHEESHVIAHDGLHQTQAAENQAAFSEAFKTIPGAAQQFSALADLSVDAITKSGYTQQQEFAADKSAVTLVYAAGYNPASYLNFLQRLATLQAQGGGAFSTHPDAADRVNRVSTQLQTIPHAGATLADRFHQNVKF
jgi:predicted Zn-dependent protease